VSPRRDVATTARDLLGAHMSIAGGLYRSLERGRESGCSVVQICLKNETPKDPEPKADRDALALLRKLRASASG
jgi:deoxyribonuclease IV